jgi:phytol kinase
LGRFFEFVSENFPDLPLMIYAGIPSLIWGTGCLWIAGVLKRDRGWKTGYTRKVFHFFTFFSAAIIQQIWGLPVLCVFGAGVSAVVFTAVLCGPGTLMYEAFAREKDAPHRTLYVLVPYVATLLGGVFANVLFLEFVVVGYLVTGLGDAIGEPAGTRFGRHRYRVPSLRSVPSERSVEGSLAVFLVSGSSVFLLGILNGMAVSIPSLAAGSLLIGLVAAVTEALSPHGWDNFFLLIVPSWVASIWFAV